MALTIFETAFPRSERTRQAPTGTRRRFDYKTGQYTTGARAEAFADTATRTLAAVQTVCDALVSPGKGRYTVAFGGRTAMTEMGARRVTITAQPLYTKGMRLADVADTLTGFVVHEVGHTEISEDTRSLVEGWLSSEPGFRAWAKTIHALANVLDDVALEVWARNRFPGVGHTFRVTTKFVAQDEGLVNKPPRRWDPSASYTERFNFMVVAVRYRWFTRWAADAATRAERTWWVDWAERYGDPTDAPLRLEGIKAGLARLAIKPENRPPEPEPEPTPGEDDDEPEAEDDEPESFDNDDESDDDDDDDTTGGGNDDDEAEDDEPEPGDEPGEDGEDGEDPGLEVDEPGFERGLDADDDGTADEAPESDEASLSAGQDGDEDADDDGFESDEDDESVYDDPDGERIEGGKAEDASDDLGKAGEGSSNAPIYDGFEPERLTRSQQIKTVDDYVEDQQRFNDHRDRALQEQVEVEMRAVKVTDTHGHGTMKVTINL